MIKKETIIMKLTLVGIALILTSTSFVVNKETVVSHSDMRTINEKKLISGTDMVFKTGVVTQTSQKNKCDSLKCWQSILPKNTSR